MDLGNLGDAAKAAEKFGVDLPDMGDLVGKLNIPAIPTEIVTEAFSILQKDGPVAAITHVIKSLLSSDDGEVKNFGAVLKSTLGDKVDSIGVDDATKILEKLKG